ncbi:hypothetical protein A0J61_00235 [Choanephora cucurbitarum]|uniref:N-acetyltransferase domain-containing protein n=1 Tax=Choanephora cucurbitarum TaxID=101091 RepID=A0A1C7NRG0_9FUNG|nr:hypothetical protein A0J61_00235 [Choanephora cucurbitarum]
MPNPSKTQAALPRLLLRTYKASDHEQVDHMFYSTYFSLVPEGVKRKLMSPLFWILWIALYSYLLAIVPVLLSGLNAPSWASIALKVFLTFAWCVVSFAGVFVVTDRLEVVDKVEHVRQNDLSDPEVYYLNWVKQEVEVTEEEQNDNGRKKRVTFDKDAKPAIELTRKQKPQDQQTPSHFWILTLEGRPCGMVGLAHYSERILSNRPTLPPAWKLMCVALLQRYRLPVPASLQDLQAKMPRAVFAEPHEPKTATLQRLTVKTDCQGCGLATLLIDRAMSWAHEKGLEHVEAMTNELEVQAERILSGKHGFKLVSKQKKGWFGQYEKRWSCDVSEWMTAHQEAAKMYQKQKEASS